MTTTTKPTNGIELLKALDKPEIFALARSYITAKAHEETIREIVIPLYNEILRNDVELYNDLDVKHGVSKKYKRITNDKNTYLSTDEKECQRYFDLCDQATAKAGLRTVDMRPGDCPARIAKKELVDIEIKIIETLSNLMQEPALKSAEGKNRDALIDTFLKAATNHPNFKR